jgi:hypothetical protein
MTTIKINESRAIQVDKNSFSLAEYVLVKDKKKGDYYAWSQYAWPSTMENCINRLAQEMVAGLCVEISMSEFKEKWDEFLELIYKAIDGHKEKAGAPAQ